MKGGYETADGRSRIIGRRITPQEVQRRKREWEQSIVRKYKTDLKRAKLLSRIDAALNKK